MPRQRKRLLNFHPDNFHITNSDFTHCNVEHIARCYVNTVENNRLYINSKLEPFYKRALNLPESILGEVVCKIKSIEKEMGMTMPEIANEIRNYTSITTFYKDVNGRQTPIESNNILKAIRAIKEKYSVKVVKLLLYGQKIGKY